MIFVKFAGISLLKNIKLIYNLFYFIKDSDCFVTIKYLQLFIAPSL